MAAAKAGAQAAKEPSAARMPNSIGRLLEIVSEHGAEIRRLRAEHGALRVEHRVLRKCLNSSGVLPAHVFEEEWRKEDEARSASASRLAAAAGGTGGTPGAFALLDGGSDAGSMKLSMPPRSTSGGSAPSAPPRKAATSAASTSAASGPSMSMPGRKSSAGLQRERQAVTPPPSFAARTANSERRSITPKASPRPKSSDGRRPGSLVGARPRAGSLTREGSPPPRGRNDPLSGSRSRSVSGSPGRRSSIKEPPRDLYELAQPILQPDSSTEQREQAYSAVAHSLRAGASPQSWKGPETPLRTAVQVRRPEFVQLLLQARANPNETDTKGVCVLHMAAFDGQVPVCRLLLEAKGDSNVPDRHGQTPLFFAPTRAVCEVLCQHRADVNIMNQKAQSALHLAGRAGLADVLTWLGAHVSKALLEARDMHGATAAYYARHAGIQTAFLIKHKLMNFEPPNTSAGRNALSDGGPSFGTTSPQRIKGGGAGQRAGKAQPDYTLGVGGGERLPPLPEVPVHLSDDDVEHAPSPGSAQPAREEKISLDDRPGKMPLGPDQDPDEDQDQLLRAQVQCEHDDDQLLQAQCEEVVGEDTDRRAAAATRIQSRYRGQKVRRDMGGSEQHQKHVAVEEAKAVRGIGSHEDPAKAAAATKLQAAHRGRAARAQTDKLRAERRQGDEGGQKHQVSTAAAPAAAREGREGNHAKAPAAEGTKARASARSLEEDTSDSDDEDKMQAASRIQAHWRDKVQRMSLKMVSKAVMAALTPTSHRVQEAAAKQKDEASASASPGATTATGPLSQLGEEESPRPAAQASADASASAGATTTGPLSQLGEEEPPRPANADASASAGTTTTSSLSQLGEEVPAAEKVTRDDEESVVSSQDNASAAGDSAALDESTEDPLRNRRGSRRQRLSLLAGRNQGYVAPPADA